MITFRGVRGRITSVRSFSEAVLKDAGSSRLNIKIPPAIKRSPTDLLKALSDTVGVDPTAPPFAFIDDPAMIPTTAQAKRNYYMAKEMGKRAARSLAEEWPTLFAFDRDEPYLPAFRPQKSMDPLQVEATEENLLKIIENREVEDAIRLYERIRAGKVVLQESTMLELLRLSCFYNCSNIPFSELEEWHGLRNFGEVPTSSWTEGNVADLLFDTLPVTPETVSIMVCGLCKYPNASSIQRAKELFKNHRGLAIEAYESLISVSSFSEASQLLGNLKKEKKSPRIQTWNAMLKSAEKIGSTKDKIEAFEKIFGEMLHLGQTPTLSIYKSILGSITSQSSDPSNPSAASQQEKELKLAVTWLSEILESLEASETIQLTSDQDNYFFFTAMGVAGRAGNLSLAERLVALYENKKNDVKMPAFTTETSFYNRYLMLYVDHTASMDDIYKKYKFLVPRIVGVGRQLTLNICKRLKANPHFPLLVRVIEDGIAAKQMIDLRLCSEFRQRLLDVSYSSLSVEERETFSNLITRLVDIWLEFSNFTEEYSKRMQMKLSHLSIGECAVLLNRIGQSDRAFQLLELVLSEEANSGETATVMPAGFVKNDLIQELFEDSLRNKDPIRASLCLEIMGNNLPRQRLQLFADKIQERCNVTEDQRRILNGFVRLKPQ